MIVKCRNCNLEFDKKPAEIKGTKHNYCKKKCKGEFLSKQTTEKFYQKSKPNGECWEWTGCLNKFGYGTARYKGKVELAHRVSYIISCGEIADGMCVCHKCDNPKCINPEHLFLGSHQENMEDMRVKLRKWSKLTFDDVEEIRESSESSIVLAKKYSVSDRAIRYARDTTHWMPLPEPPK